MELILANNNHYEPTPRLKSSPIQISFVLFNTNENIKCDCGHIYSQTLFFQFYCRNCLLVYMENITNFDTYLDIHNNINKHSDKLNIEEQYEEWFRNLCFKQIVTNKLLYSEKYNLCNLCDYSYCGMVCSKC